MSRRTENYGGFVKVIETADFRAQIRALNEEGRAEIITELNASAERIAAGARARVPVSAPGRRDRKGKSRPGPGELKSTIRAESDTHGGVIAWVRVGLGPLPRRLKGLTSARKSSRKRAKKILRKRSRRTVKPGAYAMVIEFGAPRAHKSAEPFMRPAVDAEKSTLNANVHAALERAQERAKQAG